VYGHVVKLPDIFDFQGQVVVFNNFLSINAGKLNGQMSYGVVFPEDGGGGCSQNMSEFSFNVYLSASCWTNL
jgi:hypothetical protein